ncbi:MAG: hypothetical protein R2710_24555 [Acidimicrobiales bacterium]
MAALLAACGSSGGEAASAAPEPVTYKYIIPNGTGERIEAGEPSSDRAGPTRHQRG